MRRLAVVAVLALVAVVVGMSPAWAKIPAFEMQVSPSTLSPGEPITVTVTLETTNDFPAEDLTGLIGFAPRPSDGGAIRPLSDATEVPLPRVRQGVYRGIIQAPDEPGAYVVVPFPRAMGFEDSASTDPYPEPAVVTVTDGPLLGNVAWPLTALAGLAVIVIVGRHRRADEPSPVPATGCGPGRTRWTP